MNSRFLTPFLAIALGFAGAAQAQVLMLDFGPTATTTPDNSPYHSVAPSSGTVWNQIQTSDVTANLKYADNTAATGVTVNIGAKTSVIDLDLAGTPSGNSALGTIVNTGIYTGTSVGTDGIFTGSSNLTGTSVGIQVAGLSAGTYDVYITMRNTNRASTSGYSQTAAVGVSSGAGNFDYSGYSSGTLAYSNTASPSFTTSWIEGANYVKISVTLTSGDVLNLAVHGGGEDLRGFLNSVQIVNTASAVPEPSTYALIGGVAVLGTAVGVRRRR